MLVRIILGLVAFFVALGLFSFSILNVTNHVRHEHYWSNMVTPGLNYLAQNQAVLAQVQGSPLALVAKNQPMITSVIESRLEAQQVVLTVTQDMRFKAWVLLQDLNLLLALNSGSTGEEIYSLYLSILEQVLVGDDVESELSRISESLGLEALVLFESDIKLDERVLTSLSETSRYLNRSDDRVSALLKLGSGELIAVTFRPPFTHYSWFVLTLLAALGIGILALIVFFMLRVLDRQLRSVETVASRIARGELDARVKSAGESDAVSRLGTAFNSMADHIQRLMFVQKEMIHAVSHELRTPVARIRFGVQMIEDCPDQASMQKQIKGIDGDIQELDELIDEILTYARLEQGGPILAFHEANIVEIVEQVVTEQSSTKPNMSISSEYKPGSDVWKESEVEARYIHRSIQNLVGNATRYADSRVSVICSFDKETCRVDVEDDGPGIPEEEWESVFTPFARLDDSRTRSSGGYGLGLSIVRRILYWHGGQAFLGRSQLGGAKFSLVWPRKQP